MEAFEDLVSQILAMRGYWVRTSVRVPLSDSAFASDPTIKQRNCDLDVLAYSYRDNVVRIVECKSWLDSPGIRWKSFNGSSEREASFFKLFNNNNLLSDVSKQLTAQLVESGACSSDVQIKLCLAGAKFFSREDKSLIRAHFASRGWELYDDDWVRDGLKDMSKLKVYMNRMSHLVSKLLDEDRHAPN